LSKHKLAASFATLLTVLSWCYPQPARSETNSNPPSAEIFGALPAETHPVLSPDAHWIAWADETGRKTHIVIFDLGAQRVQRDEPLPERMRLRSLYWSDNETLLATLSESGEVKVPTNRAGSYAVTIALNPAGEGARILPTMAGHPTNISIAMRARMIRVLTNKPHTVIMSTGSALLEVNTVTSQAAAIRYGSEHTVGWAVDRDGKPLAREDWDWKKGAYRVYALNGESYKEILSVNDSDPPTLAGLLPDDSALVLLANNGHEHQAAWILPLDGSAQKLLADDPEADITSAYYDAYSGAIVGFYTSGTKTTMRWLDSAAQRRYDALQKSFPNSRIDVYGWTIDGSKTLARVESASSPPIYYLVDFKTHHADIAAEEYPALAGVKLGEFSEITYKARDGTDIPAYLTLPPGAAGIRPLVVLPHGGPQARDFPTFNWIVQFLASRGYAVLQPQFRGSTGFGESFQRAGYRQWGGLMQDDVTDGVRAMIDQRVADPKHVCIVGLSYGGYAALAGAAFTPDLYACAISVNGVSDLRAFFKETVPRSSSTFVKVYSASMSQWTERIGPVDSALDKRSPIHSVASIKAPILIVYGNSDSAVPNDQSLGMEQALRSERKQVTLVKLEDEDHWLSRSETRVQLLKAFDEFLHANLQNTSPE
jgi:dipeptidyl aminopeptidase/acylaminoacyl peptidase